MTTNRNRSEESVMKMRSFEASDWDAFAGAEGWLDSMPLICEGEFEDGMGYTLVLAKNGGNLIADDEMAERGGYVLARELATVEEARAFADRLGQPKTKREFFFALFTSPQGSQ